MSPASYSAASPAPLISDADVVIVYDSEEEEFEHQRQAELSTVVVGSPGSPRQAKFHPVVPQLAAEVMAEEFARVLAWAQGPLMLEWCQNKAPCVLCTWQGEACIFDVPSMGLQHDTSVCLLCRMSHKKCSISLEWQAVGIAAEQGWDEDWVQSQLGKVWKTQILGEVSVGWSAGQVGPPRTGRREGASLVADLAPGAKLGWGEMVVHDYWRVAEKSVMGKHWCGTPQESQQGWGNFSFMLRSSPEVVANVGGWQWGEALLAA
ncbi:hypothetical protein E4T56_gene20665 [Termitomyces sp. T112]|nr:hypothetical protein E4T56_gene20665 [Termitomyces sp. T112]